MDSFSGVSGNIDENISYTTAKEEGTTAPAVKDGQIRLYQSNTGGKGGSITITANEGYTINSVTIGSGMETTVVYVVDAGTESDEEDIKENGTLEVSGISATSVKFYCMGADKNHRLYVNYLNISYVKNE